LTETGTDMSPLGVLGFSARQERLYRLLLRHSGSRLAELAELAGMPVGELREQVRRFAGVGVVELRGDLVVARPPREALGRLITEETRRVRSRSHQLDDVRDLLPSLHADHLEAYGPRGRPVPVEEIEGTSLTDLVRSLSASSTGDVLWLRPDPWNLPGVEELDDVVVELLESGRALRAIYSVQLLQESPELVRQRAAAGEVVRVLPHVPTRLAVFGSSSVMLGQRVGKVDGQRIVLRHPTVVAAVSAMFETLWDRALTVPALESSRHDAQGSQRQLLRQLAGGAKDEQIARALGLSLRTVRRRIADLLDELGADSRFEAGVEAARRGWV